MKILCEISIGELFDKVSILTVKSKMIKDSRCKDVKIEKALLMSKLDNIDCNKKKFFLEKLDHIHEKMWNINDLKRVKAQKKELDEEFIKISVEEDIYNDLRFELKKQINEFYNSEIFEQKSYDKYK